MIIFSSIYLDNLENNNIFADKEVSIRNEYDN